MQSQTTVRISAPPWLTDRQAELNSALTDGGGLPPGIRVEFDDEAYAGDALETYGRWLSEGRTSPTIMVMDNPWPSVFIDREQLQPLDPLLAESLTDRIREEYLSSIVSTASDDDDTLYGLPLIIDLPTILYRKDVLRQAGYTDSEFRRWSNDSMSWQQFSAVVEAGMAASGLDGFLWQGAAYEGLACCTFVDFMSSWGGAYFGGYENLFGPVGDRPITVDEQPVVDAIRMLRTFMYGPSDDAALDGYAAISPEAVVDYTEDESHRSFTDGQAIALRNWTYSIDANGAEDRLGDDLGVMPIPYEVSRAESKYGPEIGGMPAALGGWHLTVNPNAPTAKQEAAVEVLRAFHTPQVRHHLFESYGLVSPVPDDLTRDEFREADPLGRYADTLQTALENLVPRPVTRVWPPQSDAIATEVNAALRRRKGPQGAMDDLEQRLREIEESVLSPTSTPTPTERSGGGRTESAGPGSSGTRAASGSTGSGSSEPTTSSTSVGTPTAERATDVANEDGTRAGTSRESAPGFGVLAALAGFGALAWRRRRRD
ncbi:extracellular solute-binding protein [Salinigranum marinum]|uniref:extracellular solute-binding protein n=1 Tax=Salinigranum marinum TaxID=1515595 RepID=UPI002989F99F|nr:extracellular solute-binding protein [Salinigranum marinum]